MTYIEILNAFWNWRRFNVIPHSAADLFFCLLDFANAAKWEDKVTVPNSRITGKIDISEKSLFNARNILIQNGLIEYSNGKKGQAGAYKINLTTLYFFINKGSNQGSNAGSNSGVIRGVKGRTYKDNKDKIKTRQDNIAAAEEEKEEAPEMREVILLYEKNIAPITPITYDKISDWLKSVEPGVIKFAIREAVGHEKRNWKYINAIINNHFSAGRTTLAAVEAAQRSFNARNTEKVFDGGGIDYGELEKQMQERLR